MLLWRAVVVSGVETSFTGDDPRAKRIEAGACYEPEALKR